MLPLLAIFRLRQRSLVRAMALSLIAFFSSLRLAGFPYIQNLHGSRWQWAILLIAFWAMAEAARCLQRKWTLYHAAALLMLYNDLMILMLVVFLALYQ
ncbi:MAG: hypothetical protein KGN79_05950 [Acidobacteriota bacterium]|nr:hypothetical protein [Acidobacteriota bacterium]